MKSLVAIVGIGLVATVLVGSGMAGGRPANDDRRRDPIVIAYKLAIDMGVDYIEPDLVSTKDGELVARHEN